MVEDWGCAAANALDAKNLTAQASEMRRYIETLYDEVVETGGAVGAAATKVSDGIEKMVTGVDLSGVGKDKRTKKFSNKLFCDPTKLGARARLRILEKNTAGKWNNRAITATTVGLTTGLQLGAAAITFTILAGPIGWGSALITMVVGGVAMVIQSEIIDKIPSWMNQAAKNGCDLEACRDATIEATKHETVTRGIVEKLKNFKKKPSDAESIEGGLARELELERGQYCKIVAVFVTVRWRGANHCHRERTPRTRTTHAQASALLVNMKRRQWRR